MISAFFKWANEVESPASSPCSSPSGSPLYGRFRERNSSILDRQMIRGLLGQERKIQVREREADKKGQSAVCWRFTDEQIEKLDNFHQRNPSPSPQEISFIYKAIGGRGKDDGHISRNMVALWYQKKNQQQYTKAGPKVPLLQLRSKRLRSDVEKVSVSARMAEFDSSDPNIGLLHCCVVGDVSTARWLIKEKEANPNLVLKEGSGYLEANQLFYQIGDTPLTIAERFGHIPLCDYLRKSSLKSQKKSRSRSLAASPLEVTSSKTTPSSSSSSSSTVTDATTRTLVFPSSDFYSSDEEEEEEDSRKDDEGSWEMVSIMLEPRKGLGLPPRRTSTPVPNSADILTCGSPLPSSPLTSSPILTSLTSSPVTPREFRSPHSDSIPSSPLSSREFKHNTDIIIPASLTPRARNHLSPPDFRHHGSELVLPNPNRAPPLQETKHQKSFTEKILAKKKKSSTISHPNLKRRVEVFGEGEERKRTGTASLGRANSGEAKRKSKLGGNVSDLSKPHSLEWLFDTLTIAVKGWQELLQLFYYGYRDFICWKNVILGLISRYSLLTCKYILMNFQHWISHYYKEDWDTEERQQQFQIIIQTHQKTLGADVSAALLSLAQDPYSEKVTNLIYSEFDPGTNVSSPRAFLGDNSLLSFSSPRESLPPQEKPTQIGDNWISWDEVLITEQLSLLHWDIFNQVRHREILIYSRGTERKKECPNMSTLIEHFNRLSFWVVSEIVVRVRMTERVAVIEKIIRIANLLIHLQNYLGAKALHSGLYHPSITRMEKTMKEVQKSSKDGLAKLDRMLAMESTNGAEYRAALKNAKPPYVPHIGLHCKDIAFLLDGNLTKIGENINIPKFSSLWEMVSLLKTGSTASYSTISEFTEVLNFFRSPPTLEYEALFEWSKKVEPKSVETLSRQFIETEMKLTHELQEEKNLNKKLMKRIEELESAIQKTSPRKEKPIPKPIPRPTPPPVPERPERLGTRLSARRRKTVSTMASMPHIFTATLCEELKRVEELEPEEEQEIMDDYEDDSIACDDTADDSFVDVDEEYDVVISQNE